MKRAIVLALSVILALIVAAPMATAQKSSGSKVDLKKLTAEWWNWTASKDPSPLVGNYKNGDDRCDGEYVDGVFFLAGTTGGNASRSCTVPAKMPIFFPTFNVVCSEAYGVAGQDPPDAQPYDTACAKPFADFVLSNGDTYAYLDKRKLTQTRAASGLFDWNIQYYPNPFYDPAGGLPVGTWESATDGRWVYLDKGLDPGEYTLQFGGKFFDEDFNLDITYDLTVK